jgi:hypothetical protein
MWITHLLHKELIATLPSWKTFSVINPSLRDLDISHRKQTQFVLLRVEQRLQLGHVREKKFKWKIP